MRTIDADAALKALRKCQTYLYDARDPELKIELSSAEAAINNLPTIQSQSTAGQLNDGARSTVQSTDLIDRQQAIEAVGLNSWAGSRISNLPSVQPEPQEGHWIWVAGELMCSECRTIYSDLYPDYDNAVACPHCGARMKGERQK